MPLVLQRGLPLTRQQRLWWDDDTAAALLKLGGPLALATHLKVLNRALGDDRLAAMALGQKSADMILDRLLGRPTEHHQVASKLTVLFPGLDPSRLPAPPKPAVDVTPKPPIQKPFLPRTEGKRDEP